ncbi:MAG: Decaprenylphosphoryl-2-keto-beta-D-erythro-pentose reductase [Luteibacter sp.]|uniref:SDR family oxidoreductase n=1 Tax=Luteibacter sp. TaxID=1886636 RepID=UPI001381D734|nr:SDR family oxidoreductase [Luteibacter sp.]KAF1008018.1 MAG: Decaprenylphosphoryl-2-keto-beta-D-erythro-pentose reductase [Luteibacter sp.]
MQRVLIIGATSAIAEAVARIYAKRGARLFLWGRSSSKLQAMADDLGVRGAVAVGHASLDVNEIQEHASMLDRAWNELGGIDVLLIAHGTLPDQHQCEIAVDIALREFATNATSTIALLTLAAQRMEQAGKGSIAVISSVAGDRGRANNYLYGSAKAAVTTFLSGLRQRLSHHGVNVLTIKPGFVDTPMTRDFKKGALWAKPSAVASGIVNALDKRLSSVYLPWFWQGIMIIIRSIPESIFKRLRL